MNILITDEIHPQAIEILHDKGYSIDNRCALSEAEMLEVAPNYDALIVRSATKVTSAFFDAAKRLKVVGRSGVRVDNIDVVSATEHGVMVCNAPSSNIYAAAEHAIGLMIACARHIPQADASMRAGEWRRRDFAGTELYGKTLAIFGLGRIGSRVAERAASFGMKLVGYDPYISPEHAAHLGVELCDSVQDVLPRADFISIHMPCTNETKGMFGVEEFAAMRDGVFFINISRGAIVETKALADFLAAGKIAAAAVDVFDEEPCYASPLHSFKNVVLTPHIASSTSEARKRASLEIVESVIDALEGRPVATALNTAKVSEDVIESFGPYFAAAQIAGSMLSQIHDKAISEVRVKAFGSALKAEPRMLATAALSGMFSGDNEEGVNVVNADAMAERLGIRVETQVDPECTDFSSKVQFAATAGGKEVEVSFTLGGAQSKPRIVSLKNFEVDFVPKHHMLILDYEDCPGQVGKIGTILGNAGINIDTLSIGRPLTEEPKAMAAMNIDQEIDNKLMQELKEALSLYDGWCIEL